MIGDHIIIKLLQAKYKKLKSFQDQMNINNFKIGFTQKQHINKDNSKQSNS